MKHYYSTVDNIILTFGDIEDKGYYEQIPIRFERANDNGFDFAEINIPQMKFTKLFGFSEEELIDLKNYVSDNSSLIWDMARENENHD